MRLSTADCRITSLPSPTQPGPLPRGAARSAFPAREITSRTTVYTHRADHARRLYRCCFRPVIAGRFGCTTMALHGASSASRVERPEERLRSLSAGARLVARPGLPVRQTSFVGRSIEMEELSQRLASPDCRLLTILGPGGIGKTRLALEVAEADSGDVPGWRRVRPAAVGQRG